MITFPYTKGGAEPPDVAYYGFQLNPISGWEDVGSTTTYAINVSSSVEIDWQDEFFTTFNNVGYMWIAFPNVNPAFPLYLYWRDAANYGQTDWKTITDMYDVYPDEDVSDNSYTLYVNKDILLPTNIKFSTTQS